jgi:hypothetical protein
MRCRSIPGTPVWCTGTSAPARSPASSPATSLVMRRTSRFGTQPEHALHSALHRRGSRFVVDRSVPGGHRRRRVEVTATAITSPCIGLARSQVWAHKDPGQAADVIEQLVARPNAEKQLLGPYERGWMCPSGPCTLTPVTRSYLARASRTREKRWSENRSGVRGGSCAQPHASSYPEPGGWETPCHGQVHDGAGNRVGRRPPERPRRRSSSAGLCLAP